MIKLFIVYDGIQNSVFESQVIAPLVKEQDRNPNQKIVLVSFEKKKITYTHPSLTIIQLHKMPYIGIISLWYAYLQLKHLLLSMKENPGHVTARGPFAGWIARKLDKQATVQARGLAAEEYLYAHQEKKGISLLIHQIRAWQFKQLEQTVYKKGPIEAVSNALREFLHATYGTPHNDIAIARHDIPNAITEEEKKEYTALIRKTLNIPLEATVYVYSGSAKPWQCPQEIVAYCEHIHEQDPDAYFLFLTQDQDIFTNLIQFKKFRPKAIVDCVPSSQLISYLAACNVGLIWRKNHIINRVARPTKILEYQAARLTVFYNLENKKELA